MAHPFSDLSNRLKTGCVLRLLTSLYPYPQLSIGTNLKGRNSPRSAEIPALRGARGSHACAVIPVTLVVPRIWEIICNFIFLDYDGFNRAPNSGNHQVQDHKIEVQRRAPPGSPTATFNQGPPP